MADNIGQTDCLIRAASVAIGQLMKDTERFPCGHRPLIPVSRVSRIVRFADTVIEVGNNNHAKHAKIV